VCVCVHVCYRETDKQTQLTQCRWMHEVNTVCACERVFVRVRACVCVCVRARVGEKGGKRKSQEENTRT
jgi:hypothetical protein